MHHPDRSALAALAAVYALGPLATQMITPAIPFVHRDLGVPMAIAQMLVSLAFVVIAAATLIYGPLADRIGRRPVLIGGTGLFCAGSLIAALAPTPELLIAGRVVQAAGSAAGLVLARTIVLDLYGEQRSAQVIAYLTAVMIVAPMVAPTIGGLLLDHTHWRSLFALCTLAGAAALGLLLRHLPETRSAPAASRPQSALQDYTALLRDARYLAAAASYCAVMASFFAGQAALPYLFTQVLGSGATDYGLWFAVACLAYIGGNFATGRWGGRFKRETLLLASAVGFTLTSLLGVLAVQWLPWTQAVLFMPTVALSFFGALGAAQAQILAVAVQPQRAGAASGLLSALQMLIGAAVVQLIGLHQDGTPTWMLGVFVACSLCMVLAAAHALRSPHGSEATRLAARGAR